MAQKGMGGWRAKVVALALSLFVALLLAEAAVRVFVPEPYADVDVAYPMVMGIPSSGDAIGLLPHGTIIAQYDRDPFDTLPEGDRVVYRLNDWGFRDTRNESRVGEEGTSIAVLGDSFTFGEGVEANVRFTGVMAQALDPEVRVFNLGISGFGTEDERKLAAAALPRIRPDAVVVAYCLNDPVPAWAPGYEKVFGFDLVVQRDAEIGASNSPSHLVRLVSRAYLARRLTAATLDWYRSLYSGPDAQWIASREDLLRIRDNARSLNATLGVVVLPMLIRLEEDYPLTEAHRTVTDWCAENGIPVLDTLPLFLGRETESMIVHPKDRHPNAAAHALIGKAMAKFVRAELLEGK